MSNLSTFTTPGGEEMVILSRHDFDLLVAASDDLADIAAYDQTKARLAVGEDEMVPAKIVDDILNGQNPVRVWRLHRGQSVSELAAATRLSPAYLSQIETGKRRGQADTLKLIAAALEVSVDDLI